MNQTYSILNKRQKPTILKISSKTPRKSLLAQEKRPHQLWLAQLICLGPHFKLELMSLMLMRLMREQAKMTKKILGNYVSSQDSVIKPLPRCQNTQRKESQELECKDRNSFQPIQRTVQNLRMCIYLTRIISSWRKGNMRSKWVCWVKVL
jgi:hypothetical protein